MESSWCSENFVSATMNVSWIGELLCVQIYIDFVKLIASSTKLISSLGLQLHSIVKIALSV